MMKKLLLFALIFGFYFQGIAQTTTDQKEVLQKCIDLEELEGIIQKDSDNKFKQIYISQYPILFTEDIVIKKNNQEVRLISTDELKANKVAEYFTFRKFHIEGNSANVILNYFYEYDYNSKTFEIIYLTINLNKVDGQWIIINTEMKGVK